MADVYRYLREAEPVTYAVDSTDTISVGDMVRFNTGTGKATRLAAAANGSNFIGVSEGRIPIASNIDNTTGLENTIRVKAKGVHKFKTTSGDTLNHGDAVIRGADDQTVLKQGAAPANQVIGYVYTPNSTQAVAGGTGVEIEVVLQIQFPSVNLAGF